MIICIARYQNTQIISKMNGLMKVQIRAKRYLHNVLATQRKSHDKFFEE